MYIYIYIYIYICIQTNTNINNNNTTTRGGKPHSSGSERWWPGIRYRGVQWKGGCSGWG